MFESENIEFKKELTSQIYKEIIAFINAKGGMIYIGVDDNGIRIGVNNVDQTYTALTNGIRDNIMPDATMFIDYTLCDDNVIEIKIQEGTNKPYYLKSKGLKPSGVYIRQGASSVQMSYEHIREMIKTSDRDTFENRFSFQQMLTFEELEKVFSRANFEFSQEKMIILGLMDMDYKYYELAHILSDQCEHTIKVAVFEDEANTIFHSTKEFTGSIMKQLEDVYAYLLLNNRNHFSFHGLQRTETTDYDNDVLREALLNAIIHRDYSYSGSVIININPYCMEFINLGGLTGGLTEVDICNGISQPRNKKLAQLLYRMKYIEAYGTGIKRIMNAYTHYDLKPQLKLTPNTFKIIIPNKSLKYSNDVELSKTEKKILDLLEKEYQLSDKELQRILEIKQSRSYALGKKLSDLGYIDISGKGEKRTYTINEEKVKYRKK